MKKKKARRFKLFLCLEHVRVWQPLLTMKPWSLYPVLSKSFFLAEQPCHCYWWHKKAFWSKSVQVCSLWCSLFKSLLQSWASVEHVRFEVGAAEVCSWGGLGTSIWTIGHMASGVIFHSFGCLPSQGCLCDGFRVSECLLWVCPCPGSWVSLVFSYLEKTLASAWF